MLANVEHQLATRPSPKATPTPDPRDVAGWAAGAQKATRAPNVTGANDTSARERPSWLDAALMAVLPGENGLFDYVYDPRQSRGAVADVTGRPPEVA